MSTLSELEKWYRSKCDGDWEHRHGVRISTLDNPGWRIDIDLGGTGLEDKACDRAKIERSDTDWLWSWAEEGTYSVRCGPGNLEEGIRLFLAWAGSSHTRS